MRAAFAIAALAGSSFAAPHYGLPQKDVKVVSHYVVQTVVQTVYVTEGYEAYKPKHTPTRKPASSAVKPTSSAPAVTTTVVYKASSPAPTTVKSKTPAPKPTTEAPAPSSEAPAPTTEAPAPTTTAPASTPAPATGGYMDIVSEWRAKLGLKALECDSKLEANAEDTVVSSNGVMIHKLNPGTYGQVLAPGSADDFEHVFVGGWLCEIPTLPGLDGVCATQSEGWSYEGQTGHAEILTSTNYSKIGCKLYAGIWCCDLA